MNTENTLLKETDHLEKETELSPRQLADRVKELEKAIEKMCCYDGEYRDAEQREAIGRSALKGYQTIFR